jgi:hypothetical protein
MKTKVVLVCIVALGLLLAACSPAATPAPSVVGIQEVSATAVAQTVETAQDGVQPVAPAGGVRMVIKDADMELLVEDVDVALAKVTQMAADYGGYVVSSQTWEDADRKHGSLRIAVPSAQFETALNQLRNLGVKVVRETASGQDVSAEYVDLRSRLTNLEATAARVREFLKDAKTVEESLRVNQQLSELEAQIEQVKGQMEYYEGRAAFSTISVALTPQAAPARPEPKAAWDPGRTFERASDVLATLLQGLADLLIWLGVVFGPFALVGALILGLGWRLLRPRKARA